MMVQSRTGVLVLAVLALACAWGAAGQEIVLTDGSRLAGTVERYENGFAYIRLVQEGGRTVLTTMPESAVDKAATEQAQATAATADVIQEAPQTGPFKLPHNDLSTRSGPGIAALAAEEKERRADVIDSGAATGRVFQNGQRAAGIPTARDIESLSDLREQPEARSDMDAPTRVAGLRFYEARLEALSRGFAVLDEEWADMWSHCTPVTYVGGSARPESPTAVSPPTISYREAVMDSFRGTDTASRMGDSWSISCMRRDSDYVARGRQIVDAYDHVFTAYSAFAESTGQSAQVVARALPSKSR